MFYPFLDMCFGLGAVLDHAVGGIRTGLNVTLNELVIQPIQLTDFPLMSSLGRLGYPERHGSKPSQCSVV